LKNESSDDTRQALTTAFKKFFRVVSITHLKNPPLYEKLDSDKDFQASLDALAEAISARKPS